MSLKIKDYKSITVLTGAGISVASGLRSFRGPNGLWSDPDTERLSKAQSFREDPANCWRFWGGFREQAYAAEPNQAHLVLAQLESKIGPGQKFTLITQNIDELHQKAGSKSVVELHGSLFKTRCSASPPDGKCDLPLYRDIESHADAVPHCPRCAAALRPDIVLFDEMLPAEAEWLSKKALRDCDLFIAVGTSGTVSPAAHFVEWAKYVGAHTVLVNLEAMNPPNRAFDREVLGPAEETLATLFG